jgi:multisubunit Na+/H+ antiporter MnhF subunit
MIEFIYWLWSVFEPYVPILGACFGICGALVIWQPTMKAKVVGFELWVYSNIFWIIFGAVIITNYWLVVMNVVFLVSSLAGIVKHFPLMEIEQKYITDLLAIPPKE